jgi:Ca-activated chloride channel family protein
MSRRFASLLLGLSLAACASGASAQRVALVTQHGVAGDRAEWLHGSAMHTRLVVGADGETYVGLWVDTPRAPGVQRAPLDVALVVDTSGSMSGDKIENARVAAASFIDGLADGDIVSLYAFSDDARQLTPPTVVTPLSRAMMLQQVRGLYAAGGTNIGAGLAAAEGALAAAPSSHPVRRLVLISDGRATVGPSSAGELSDLAARVTENGSQVSAIGVGLDYDEGTLGAIAARTAGRLYHLEQPQQMAVILHDELELLGHTVATNAVLEFAPAPGVVLEPVGVAHARREGVAYAVPLGSLYGAQHREVLFRVRAPFRVEGAQTLGNARLRYEDPASRGARRSSNDLAIRVEAVRGGGAGGVDERVAAMVTRWDVAQSQLRAARYMNEGDVGRADAALAEAQAQLQRAQTTVRDASAQRALQAQAAAVSRNRASTSTLLRAPAAAAPAARRGAALQMNADSMHDMGY